MGRLYIVATPIGNLQDMTNRAIDTLSSVDLILCEDTRVTRNLLARFDISTHTQSFHQHSDDSIYAEVLELLESGRDLALVTDAGTPGISDPGGRLVEFVTAHNSNIEVLSIPGPSAVAAALSISGFPADKFIFLGFPPHKKRRKKFFEDVAHMPYTTVFYESPHRIKKAMNDLVAVLEPETQVCLARELTKKFESTYRGTIEEIAQMDIPEKGEYVVMVRR